MNNNKDFPRELLTEIYHSIRWEESGRGLIIDIIL